MTAATVPAHHGNRLDALDGLRTVAVGLVILFHVRFPASAAGYLGVDVFFVLSGFLITKGLIRALERPSLGLPAFWARRFKRLAPAALLVVLVVVVWALLAADAFRRYTLLQDAWWTILYVANWRFIQSASYFASDGTTSPLIHMWSLAVEEQFYLGWPLVLGLVALLLSRRRAWRVPALTVVAAVVVVASAGVMWWLHATAGVERAYMGTDAKAFEPMLGALLALVLTSPRARALVRRTAPATSLLAPVGMVALFAVLDGPAPWYFRGGALVFCALTAVLIAALAEMPESPLGRVLAWAPVSYLGRISYGIYLWHWPYAVWLATHSGQFRPARAVLVVALTIATASASYHFLEMPIREGRISVWLTTRRALVAFPAVTVVAGVALTVLGGTPFGRYSPVLVSVAHEETVLVVGDSVPQRMLPVLAPLARERGMTMFTASAGGCSPLSVAQRISPTDEDGPACVDVAERQEEMVRATRPRVVLWWSRYEIADRYVGSRLLTAGTTEFWAAQERDLTRAIDRLTADGAILVFVRTERPGIGMLSRCSKTACHPFLDRMVTDDALRRHWNELVTARAATDDRLRVIDIDDVLCRPGTVPGEPASLCDDADDAGRLARPDGSHIDLPVAGDRVAAAILDRMTAVAPG